MTTKGVKFLIDAEDRATAKIRQTTENVERQVKQVKDVGGRSKASAELVGTLANAFGGSGIGQFTSQLAEASDRISAFGEVAEQGGAGAVAFKAGLVATVGVLSFKFGQAIGDAIFETRKFRKELEEAAQVSRELDDAFSQRLGQRFADEKERIGLIVDPDEQAKAFEELETQIQTELKGASTQISRLKKQVEEFNASWDFTEVGKQQNLLNQQGIEAAKQRRKLLQDQLLELQRQSGERAKNIAAQQRENANQAVIEKLRQEVALTGASAREREKAAADIKNLEGEQLQTALALIDKKHDILAAEKERLAVQKEKEKAEQKERAEAERIANLRESTLRSLKLQTVELTQGKEAASALALQFQGIGVERSQAIAAIQARLKEANDLRGGGTRTTALIGRDDRFGSGRGERQAQLRDRQDRLNANKRRDELLKQAVKALEELNEKSNVPNVTIPVKGR